MWVLVLFASGRSEKESTRHTTEIIHGMSTSFLLSIVLETQLFVLSDVCLVVVSVSSLQRQLLSTGQKTQRRETTERTRREAFSLLFGSSLPEKRTGAADDGKDVLFG